MRFSVGGIFSIWKGEPGNKKFCGTFHNHVTDYGMNTMVTKSLSSLTTTLHVGSGSTPPQNSDLILENEIANTTTTTVSTTVSSSSKGYVGYRRRFKFSSGQAAGNLTELGLSDGISLFNRQLFLNPEGNPTNLLVGSSEELEILCEIRMYSQTTGLSTTVPSTVIIDGKEFSYNFGLGNLYYSPESGGVLSTQPLNIFNSIYQWAPFQTTTQDYSSSVVYSSSMGKSYIESVSMSPYVDNSFELNFTLTKYSGSKKRIDVILASIATSTNYYKWSPSINIGISPGYNIYTETPWQATYSYTVGDRIIPYIGDEFIYEVTSGGTSHSVAPVWPNTISGTVTDGGGVEYKCVAPLLVVEDTESLTLTIKISWTRE